MSAKSKKQASIVRRQFTDDFKREAVQMLLDGHSAPSVVERLGLSGTNLLYRWKRMQLDASGLRFRQRTASDLKLNSS